MQFPNLLALNNPRCYNMLLKSINQFFFLFFIFLLIKEKKAHVQNIQSW